MKKTHLSYLKKAVTIAVNCHDSADVPAILRTLKAYKPPIYGLIRDITGDARFHTVTERDPFWYNYGVYEIRLFIDSLTGEIWKSEDKLFSAKEYFLNRWFASNFMPLSENEKGEIMIRMSAEDGDEKSDSEWNDKSDNTVSYEVSDNTFDYSDTEGIIDANSLPPTMGELASGYMSNSRGAVSEPHEAMARFMQKIDPTIEEMARKIGRAGGAGKSSRPSRFRHSSRSDINGITLGDDLNSLLPQELATLGTPDTEDLFYKRFVQKRLQVFSSASSSSNKNEKHKGPIFICIDTSGSMTGEPEKMAKTLALAVAIIARRKRRPVCMVNYSHTASFFVIKNLERKMRGFLSFLSNSYSGGNDENMLFDFIFRKLPEKAGYKQFGEQFECADLLIISDFLWGPLDKETQKLIRKARRNGMKFYALTTGKYPTEYFEEEDEEEFSMNSGFSFFADCDHKYRYSDGQCVCLDKSSSKKGKRGSAT